MILTIEEVKELYKFFQHEYISYEEFPLLILLVKRLRDELTDDSGELV